MGNGSREALEEENEESRAQLLLSMEEGNRGQSDMSSDENMGDESNCSTPMKHARDINSIGGARAMFMPATAPAAVSLRAKVYLWTLIFGYIVLNSSLNLANRYALGMTSFSFPISLTCMHMLFSFSVLAPYYFTGSRLEGSIAIIERSWKVCTPLNTSVARFPVRRVALLCRRHKSGKRGTENLTRAAFPHISKTERPVILSRRYQGIVCIGVFLALNISLNNASLVGMSLVLNQVVRSGIPVVTAILAVFVEGKVPTVMRAVGLVPICLGVVISIYEGSKMEGTFFSLALCIAGMLSNAFMMTVSGKVMEEKIDAIQLACFTAPVSLTVLVYHFIVHEYASLLEHVRKEPRSSAIVLLGTSAMALRYNIVHYQVIRATSAVTTTVLGNVKIVLIVFLSGIFFNETSSWSARMIAGTVVTLTGFIIYSWAGLEERRAASKKVETRKS